jgi:hypothetical protein
LNQIGFFYVKIEIILNKPFMKKNMGMLDRIIRSVLALIIGILYFTGTISGALGLILLIGAIVFLATSFVSFCPLYLPFGISTCKVKEPKA